MPTSSRHRPPLTTLFHPTAGETTLLLIRHGRTAANRQRVMQGVTDLPLDAEGSRQAERIAAHLADQAPIDALLSSPLARALSTARAIGERIGLEPVVVPGLIEMDFGRYEGAPFDQVATEEPELAARFLDLDDYEVGWPGGDSRGSFYARVWETFDAILRQHAAHRVAVVAHGGVFGAFLAMLEGKSPNDLSVYDLHNCSLTHLHVTAAHTIVHCRNDIGHLDGVEEEAG